MMTYQEVIDEIQGKRRFGTVAGVEAAARMLAALGSPQAGMRLIHIAGTNGKGSVAAFLCAILREAGVRTGMFTSPHLVDFEERIQVDGQMIGRETVKRIGEELLRTEFGVAPTMFDYCLAMALLYFKEQRCGAVILETGLGGRLDSTNAVETPDVTVITKIGYDHTEILGNTIEEIAAEKAGIIKPGTALVTESQLPEALAVLTETAERVGVGCFQAVKPDEIRDRRFEDGMQVCSYGAYGELAMRLFGTHQYENAAAAVLAAELFLKQWNGTAAETDAVPHEQWNGTDVVSQEQWSESGTETAAVSQEQETANGIRTGVVSHKRCGELTDEGIRDCIRRGIRNAVWPGRMEILCRDPFFMVDGAHNGCGAAALRDSLAMLFPGEKFRFLMGVMADKDYGEMVELLLPLAQDVTTVTVQSSRALEAEKLAELIRQKGTTAVCAPDLSTALSDMGLIRDAKIIAFGSLYFIGEIRALWGRG